MLASLRSLGLRNNQITDDGCAALTSAIRSGVLPKLFYLLLSRNPASALAICEAMDV